EAFYQVVYRPKAQPLVSIVLRVAGSPGAVKQRVESLCAKTRYGNYEIVLVAGEEGGDGAAPDRVSVRTVACADISNRAVARNRGAEQARGDVVCFLDDEVEPLTQT